MAKKTSKTEVIDVKTKNGTARVERSGNSAVVSIERTCYGFKEQTTERITKLNDECIHFAFGTKEDIINNLKPL